MTGRFFYCCRDTNGPYEGFGIAIGISSPDFKSLINRLKENRRYGRNVTTELVGYCRVQNHRPETFLKGRWKDALIDVKAHGTEFFDARKIKEIDPWCRWLSTNSFVSRLETKEAVEFLLSMPIPSSVSWLPPSHQDIKIKQPGRFFPEDPFAKKARLIKDPKTGCLVLPPISVCDINDDCDGLGTPSWIIKMIENITQSQITLDVASSELFNRMIDASKFYHKDNNGLFQDWVDKKGRRSNALANHPWTDWHLWCPKITDQLENTKHLFWIIPDRVSTNKNHIHSVMKCMDLLWMPQARINFDTRYMGDTKSPDRGSFMYYKGPAKKEFTKECEENNPVGGIVMPIGNPYR